MYGKSGVNWSRRRLETTIAKMKAANYRASHTGGMKWNEFERLLTAKYPGAEIRWKPYDQKAMTVVIDGVVRGYNGDCRFVARKLGLI